MVQHLYIFFDGFALDWALCQLTVTRNILYFGIFPVETVIYSFRALFQVSLLKFNLSIFISIVSWNCMTLLFSFAFFPVFSFDLSCRLVMIWKVQGSLVHEGRDKWNICSGFQVFCSLIWNMHCYGVTSEEWPASVGPAYFFWGLSFSHIFSVSSLGMGFE